MSRTAKIVTLAELCKKAKVAPRVARRRLRQAGKEVPQPAGHRWEWPITKAKDVIPYISD